MTPGRGGTAAQPRKEGLPPLYGFLIQFLLEFQNIRLLHVITDENGEADIFADVYRHIVRREHKEHNQPQQQQHQCRTDTGRYELHIEQ